MFSPREREAWLRKLPAPSRPLAELLMQEQDGLLELRRKAEKAMLAEARRHRAWGLVKSCPGLGEIRTAQLLPIVVTPYRFKNKRSFWAYSGLGIVMRSSSDWVRTQSGEWVKAPIQQTRGLNRNSNRTLKGIFKGAATTVIGQAKDEPGRAHGPKSPRIGYAPLVNRTKQWAPESQIEGWFPPPGGERQGWKVTWTTGAETTPDPTHRAPTNDPDMRKLRTLAVTPVIVSAWVKCVLTACPIEVFSRTLLAREAAWESGRGRCDGSRTCGDGGREKERGLAKYPDMGVSIQTEHWLSTPWMARHSPS